MGYPHKASLYQIRANSPFTPTFVVLEALAQNEPTQIERAM